jgi:penicillin-binding protein 1C
VTRLRRWWRPASAGLTILLALALWIRLGPLPAGLLDDPAPSTIVLDRRGQPLYEARAADGTRGIRLTASTLPRHLVDATLAAEDRRFWSHPGIDALSIARAIKTNLAERSIVEGGSTISQQLAKLLLARRDPGRRRGWGAKIHEAVVALRLEHRFEKRELLAMYLNLANYGNQIAGVERASRAYFNVPSAMLTPAQAAFLAGLPQRPSGFNPYRNREAATSRQRVVLRRMEAARALTAAQAREARDERLEFSSAATELLAPHFVQMVLAASDEQRRPPTIETTIDADLQRDVIGVIESHRSMLRRHGAGAVAVVVLDHRSGEWLAWEGSGDYHLGRGGTINGPVMPRQPGSALKPFTYALAFEHGLSPASVLADVPSSFPTAEPGIVYTPRNYDGRFRGPLLARAALAGSENVPAVSLASEVGVPNLQRFLTHAGLSTLDRTAAHYGLGLTLGNAEVRLDELVAAYGALARGGEWIEPRSVKSAARPVTRRIVSPRTAFWITDVLADPEAREYAFGRGGSLELPFPVAVKTGTSQAYHDNWTIGYSRHVTVGVWVGNFDRTPLRYSSGVTGAAPVFHGVMLAAERRVAGDIDAGLEILTPPSGTARTEICALSGAAANAWCPTRRMEWTASEQVRSPCRWHHLTDGGVQTYLPPGYSVPKVPKVPKVPEVPEVPMVPMVPMVPGVPMVPKVPGVRLAIVSPADGSTYLIDPTLRREFQAIPLRVAAAAGDVLWSVGNRTIGKAGSDDALEWPLVPGRHRIVARDSRGQSAEAIITVR